MNVSFSATPVKTVTFGNGVTVRVSFVAAGEGGGGGGSQDMILTWGIKHETQAFSTGPKKAFMVVPVSGTITKWELMGDAAGSCVLDIWNDSFVNFPPTVADSITASSKPTLTGTRTASDATLTGWSRAVAAGDKLYINVDGNGLLSVVLNLFITPS